MQINNKVRAAKMHYGALGKPMYNKLKNKDWQIYLECVIIACNYKFTHQRTRSKIHPLLDQEVYYDNHDDNGPIIYRQNFVDIDDDEDNIFVSEPYMCHLIQRIFLKTKSTRLLSKFVLLYCLSPKVIKVFYGSHLVIVFIPLLV